MTTLQNHHTFFFLKFHEFFINFLKQSTSYLIHDCIDIKASCTILNGVSNKWHPVLENLGLISWYYLQVTSHHGGEFEILIPRSSGTNDRFWIEDALKHLWGSHSAPKKRTGFEDLHACRYLLRGEICSPSIIFCQCTKTSTCSHSHILKLLQVLHDFRHWRSKFWIRLVYQETNTYVPRILLESWMMQTVHSKRVSKSKNGIFLEQGKKKYFQLKNKRKNGVEFLKIEFLKNAVEIS